MTPGDVLTFSEAVSGWALQPLQAVAQWNGWRTDRASKAYGAARGMAFLVQVSYVPCSCAFRSDQRGATA